MGHEAPNEALLAARRELAAEYFETCFLPLVEQRPQLTRREAERSLRQFQSEASRNGQRGTDFQLMTVWAAAKHQVLINDRIAKVAPHQLPANAELAHRACQLLESIEISSTPEPFLARMGQWLTDIFRKQQP